MCEYVFVIVNHGSLMYVCIYIYMIYLFSASLEFYLLCHLLKTEADQVVITVMEVYREEQSVRRVRARSRSNTDRLQMLWHEYTAREMQFRWYSIQYSV